MTTHSRSGPIVVLTGAGISAKSGLPTFRGAGGLWEGHRVEDVATPRRFARDPALVQRFYNLRRAQLREPGVQPNAAHLALAQLERRWPGEVLVVTQNVDDLHERAGSRNLIHLHGELMRALVPRLRQPRAGQRSWAPARLPRLRRRRPAAARHRLVRRDALPHGRGRAALARCALFVAIGTSGQVYPAAGFVEAVRAGGAARTIEINLEPLGRQRGVRRAPARPAAAGLVPALAAGAAAA